MTRTYLVFVFGLALVACGDDAGPTCVANLDLNCQPLNDPPTFQAIFDTTLKPTCGAGSGTCHSADSAKGGLVFADPDAAYALLLGQTDGRVRVVPGDPACSLILERLDATTAKRRMPPGSAPLPEAERCNFVHWIADGANR